MSVKPSCAARKLTEEVAGRPSWSNLSAEPEMPHGELAGHVAVAPPEAAHLVAELVVPFEEGRREGAELVAARAHVPGLGDELDPAQHRVLPDRLEEGVVRGRSPRAVRPSVEARSKRNPSTCMVSTQ